MKKLFILFALGIQSLLVLIGLILSLSLKLRELILMPPITVSLISNLLLICSRISFINLVDMLFILLLLCCMLNVKFVQAVQMRLPCFSFFNLCLLQRRLKTLILFYELRFIWCVLLGISNNLGRDCSNFHLQSFPSVFTLFKELLVICNILFKVVKNKEFLIQSDQNILHMFVISFQL